MYTYDNPTIVQFRASLSPIIILLYKYSKVRAVTNTLVVNPKGSWRHFL